jgi:hypothetical protein
MHMPPPSQTKPESIALVQLVAPQLVAEDGKPQPPAPSHVPPHVPLPPHSSAGSDPAAIGEQVPLALLHDSQRSPQSESQQVPSAQKPEAQSVALTHGCPFAAGTMHWPLRQTAPKEH